MENVILLVKIPTYDQKKSGFSVFLTVSALMVAPAFCARP